MPTQARRDMGEVVQLKPPGRRLKAILEAALMAAGRPLSVDDISELFVEEERPQRRDIRRALSQLERDYEGRGVALREVASGFRIQVRAEYGTWVSRLLEERPARYSRALLETLALIAYRQPITRAEIEEIRGVSVSTNIVKTLTERHWVRVVGHREVPGRPGLLATTREFLDYFGLKGLDDLPPLAELRDPEKLGLGLDLGGGSGEGPKRDIREPGRKSRRRDADDLQTPLDSPIGD